jgi:xanthine/uracil permease
MTQHPTRLSLLQATAGQSPHHAATQLRLCQCSHSGDGHYVGLGFLTFVTIIVVEIFGSPFMRNCSAIIGLLFGWVGVMQEVINVCIRWYGDL